MQNYMKTILNGFKTWVSDVVKTSTADWNQSDKEAANYIKNRTHYDDIIKTDISGATYTISGITLSNLTVTHEPIPLELGQVWQMRQMHYSGSWTDAVEEEVKQDEYGTLYIGSLEGNYLTKTELTLMSGTVQQGFDTVEIICVSGYATQGEIKQLDEKYIPDSVARTEDVMNVTNPAGTGSFSMNRLDDTDIGEYSSTEGCQNTASGVYSHAEGYCTIADSEAQHVQGKFNLPDGDGVYTHIVGNGTSDGARSNAHTLDTQGNAWFAGDVYVGSTSGTNIDEGSKKIATEEQVIEAMKAFQTFIESFYTGDAIILLDTKTGKKYLIQIEDGNIVSKLTMEEVLIDFDYTKEEDGTYSLTAWKETLNGDASTELIIPDDSSITL